MCITARTLDESSHCLSAPRPPPPCRPPLPHSLHLIVAVVVVHAVVARPRLVSCLHPRPAVPNSARLASLWPSPAHRPRRQQPQQHHHPPPSHCRPSLVGRPAPNYTLESRELRVHRRLASKSKHVAGVLAKHTRSAERRRVGPVPLPREHTGELVNAVPLGATDDEGLSAACGKSPCPIYILCARLADGNVVF